MVPNNDMPSWSCPVRHGPPDSLHLTTITSVILYNHEVIRAIRTSQVGEYYPHLRDAETEKEEATCSRVHKSWIVRMRTRVLLDHYDFILRPTLKLRSSYLVCASSGYMSRNFCEAVVNKSFSVLSIHITILKSPVL